MANIKSKLVYAFAEGNRDLKDLLGGKGANLELHLGVCGEHGGDPESIHFFNSAGLDYVSCSPYRVPIARLEAGRAALASI